jgi:hypothetical protein
MNNTYSDEQYESNRSSKRARFDYADDFGDWKSEADSAYAQQEQKDPQKKPYVFKFIFAVQILTEPYLK